MAAKLPSLPSSVRPRRGKLGSLPPRCGAGVESREEGERHPERQQSVEDQHPPHAGEARRHREEQASPEGAPFADEPAAEEVRDEDRRLHREGRHQPRRPRGDAEDAIAGEDEPVEEGRLVEIRLVEQRRDEPVSAGQHLARNLGVASLVGLEEPEVETRIQEQRRHDDEQRQREARGGDRVAGVAGEEDVLPERGEPAEDGARPGHLRRPVVHGFSGGRRRHRPAWRVPSQRRDERPKTGHGGQDVCGTWRCGVSCPATPVKVMFRSDCSRAVQWTHAGFVRR